MTVALITCTGWPWSTPKKSDETSHAVVTPNLPRSDPSTTPRQISSSKIGAKITSERMVQNPRPTSSDSSGISRSSGSSTTPTANISTKAHSNSAGFSPRAEKRAHGPLPPRARR